MDNNENKKTLENASPDKKNHNNYKYHKKYRNYPKKKRDFRDKDEKGDEPKQVSEVTEEAVEAVETVKEAAFSEAKEAKPEAKAIKTDAKAAKNEAKETAPEVPAEKAEEQKEVEIIGIRFRNSGKVYFFSPGNITFEAGEHAIVETVRGVEYGDVTTGNKLVSQKEIVSPLKTVIRKATEEDAERNKQNRALEEAARPIWDEAIKRHALVMQLVDIEYTFDNTKLIFYFTADGRVDFRDLVKDLASTFRTRIELRQIGVRDEAKLIGGLGICGRPFCCKTFLSDLNQVTIRMAKDQNLSLSSAKISGNCGKLMCCLKFEHEVYEREYATFPKVDSIVTTSQGKGVIVESNFLTGKVKVKMNDTNGTLKVFAPADVKVIGVAKNDAVDKSLLELEDK